MGGGCSGIELHCMKSSSHKRGFLFLPAGSCTFHLHPGGFHDQFTKGQVQ